ncbi:hypothetical protein HanXRQr2_Chr01g0009121 [Helianthus annuus]|uniref:Uncharacterized protein n=1 Tax=Helianthus annuus TaxID=4232 RepID=A0A251T6P9_HELAN|nr:hypothetical protein HanXRQr2_Chr01g0009121 [Helianthus annuus]KAJ0955959.1 hypothetical protein HanPSC8_Chr01g0008931 [Helianthus annuus]
MVPWTLYKPHKLQLFDHSILNSILINCGASKQITSLAKRLLNTSTKRNGLGFLLSIIRSLANSRCLKSVEP